MLFRNVFGEVGMAPFLALIHDFQNDRRALYTQIAEQIEQIEAHRKQNNSLNAVLLERDFDQESRRIDETVAALQAFKNALFDTTESGISAKELYLTAPFADSTRSTVALEDVYQQFHLQDVDNFVQRLTSFSAYQQALGEEHIWAKRVSFSAFTNADLSKADQAILGWVQRRQTANEQMAALLEQPLVLAELLEWQAHDWELTALLALLDVPDASQLWEVVTLYDKRPIIRH